MIYLLVDIIHDIDNQLPTPRLTFTKPCLGSSPGSVAEPGSVPRSAEEWIVPVEIQARTQPAAARVPGGDSARGWRRSGEHEDGYGWLWMVISS